MSELLSSACAQNLSEADRSCSQESSWRCVGPFGGGSCSQYDSKAELSDAGSPRSVS